MKRTSAYFFTVILFCFFSTNIKAQIITTIAGSGTPPNNYGYTGDGGQATQATLYENDRVDLDDSGNIYISDGGNNVIRKITKSTGIITTIAGNGTNGYSGDGGQATDAELAYPVGVCVDDSGDFYISDYGNGCIRKVTAKTGIIKTIAGTGSNGWNGDGIQATSAQLSYPTGITLDDSGNIIITDQWNWVIREISAKTGIITTVAGDHNLMYSFSGNGGPATNAAIWWPSGTVVDDSGNLYISDSHNQEIRKVTKATGIITDYAGSPTAASGYSGDGGPATAAEFNGPGGLSMDNSGNIYITDANNVIRKITKSTGIITTVAGDYPLGAGFSGDGGPATTAQLNNPQGVTVDACGNFYIADYDNNLVRKVTVENDSVKVFPLNPSLCGGSSDTLTASGAGIYSWSPSTGLSATTGSMVIANPAITTTYTINGISMCSGAAIPTTIVVTVTTAPPVTVTPDSPSVCNGQHITLVANGGMSYQWVGTPDTADSISVNPSIDTAYELIVTNGTCSSDTFISVSVRQAPALIIQPPSPVSVCLGQTIVLSVPVSGTNYMWSPSSTLSSSTADTVVSTPLTQTTYIVTGIDSLGCAVTSDSEVVMINMGPSKPTIIQHDSALISSSTQSNQWLRNDTIINGATNQDYIVTTAGYYQVTVSNPANGCSTTSDSVHIIPSGINQLTVSSGKLTVYPNPTSSEIIVNISSSVGEIKDWNLQITDVFGRTVYTKRSLNYYNKIDLSNLSNGVYFISVFNKTGRTIIPIVKQN